MTAPPIIASNAAYEKWLQSELRGDLIKKDLRDKWKKMADGPFPFLRATYWRWAETIFEVCPSLEKAPWALCVGDIHLENFSVWRDDDGRLVWGVNDFDEAARMPYVLDLVRLATSACLARPKGAISLKAICAAILSGYRKGLKTPHPFVLDDSHRWLRDVLAISDDERAEFWTKMETLKRPKKLPRKRYRRAIHEAMPDSSARIVKLGPRTAGTGSLGRPRWVAIADWRGGLIVREAKALVPSAWTRIKGRGSDKLRCDEIASGRYRAPEPGYAVENKIVVRRLSPNARKIEVKKKKPGPLLSPRMLEAMGHELANIHLGTGRRQRAIERDFARRRRGWLPEAANAAAQFISDEYKDWRRR